MIFVDLSRNPMASRNPYQPFCCLEAPFCSASRIEEAVYDMLQQWPKQIHVSHFKNREERSLDVDAFVAASADLVSTPTSDDGSVTAFLSSFPLPLILRALDSGSPSQTRGMEGLEEEGEEGETETGVSEAAMQLQQAAVQALFRVFKSNVLQRMAEGGEEEMQELGSQGEVARRVVGEGLVRCLGDDHLPVAAAATDALAAFCRSPLGVVRVLGPWVCGSEAFDMVCSHNPSVPQSSLPAFRSFQSLIFSSDQLYKLTRSSHSQVQQRVVEAALRLANQSQHAMSAVEKLDLLQPLVAELQGVAGMSEGGTEGGGGTGGGASEEGGDALAALAACELVSEVQFPPLVIASIPLLVSLRPWCLVLSIVWSLLKPRIDEIHEALVHICTKASIPLPVSLHPWCLVLHCAAFPPLYVSRCPRKCQFTSSRVGVELLEPRIDEIHEALVQICTKASTPAPPAAAEGATPSAAAAAAARPAAAALDMGMDLLLPAALKCAARLTSPATPGVMAPLTLIQADEVAALFNSMCEVWGRSEEHVPAETVEGFFDALATYARSTHGTRLLLNPRRHIISFVLKRAFGGCGPHTSLHTASLYALASIFGADRVEGSEPVQMVPSQSLHALSLLLYPVAAGVAVCTGFYLRSRQGGGERARAKIPKSIERLAFYCLHSPFSPQASLYALASIFGADRVEGSEPVQMVPVHATHSGISGVDERGGVGGAGGGGEGMDLEVGDDGETKLKEETFAAAAKAPGGPTLAVSFAMEEGEWGVQEGSEPVQMVPVHATHSGISGVDEGGGAGGAGGGGEGMDLEVGDDGETKLKEETLGEEPVGGGEGAGGGGEGIDLEVGDDGETKLKEETFAAAAKAPGGPTLAVSAGRVGVIWVEGSDNTGGVLWGCWGGWGGGAGMDLEVGDDGETKLKEETFVAAAKAPGGPTLAGVFVSLLKRSEEIRVAVYRLLAAVVEREWAAVELCGDWGLVQMVTDAQAERHKAAMDWRHSCCVAMSTAAEAQHASISFNCTAQLAEAVRRGPYLRPREIEPRPIVVTDERPPTGF
ncbi:unnamed protein product [Closterium sp. Yama58-4]|nr:unnamed protein product [Closterium sp. Yama58-4]